MNRFGQIRYKRGLSLREVAEGSGVSRSTVIRLENGAKATAPVARKLADYYKVQVSDLLPADPDSGKAAA